MDFTFKALIKGTILFAFVSYEAVLATIYKLRSPTVIGNIQWITSNRYKAIQNNSFQIVIQT